MFDPHHHNPHRIVPLHRQSEITCSDKVINQRARFVSIGFHFGRRWPIVGFIIQVIPRHFIDTNRQRRLQYRVDSLVDKFGDIEFIHKKYGSVAVVENQRMP